MKVAVIGSGIAGMAAAHHLSKLAAVTLYEAQDRLGGHTDTHDVATAQGRVAVDSGFIVYNEPNYPGFGGWLKELGVASQSSDMSFSVSCPRTGLEYGTDRAGALFCQPRNLLSRRFLGMLRDIRRFYREAPAALHARDPRSLGSYLQDNGYGPGLAELHLAPMCGALWSQDAESALDLPIVHVVAFMAHHRMLGLRSRPAWRVVKGGSRRYVEAFERHFTGRIRTGEPVQAVWRQGGRVRLTTGKRVQWYDAVVVCTHSDQALAMLDGASAAERAVLGAIRYRDNVAVVHSDPAAMPGNRRAWSSWNARTGGPACSVTYWMNSLQSLPPGAENYFVTLNPDFKPRAVHAVRHYAHPVFDQAALATQRRLVAVNGCRNTYFAGAYWGWGFHEDGYQSAMEVLRAFQRRHAHAA